MNLSVLSKNMNFGVPNLMNKTDYEQNQHLLQNHVHLDLWKVTGVQIGLGILLFFFSIATVFGNLLVIIAVARERYLQTTTNYFITSLALADCLVGLIVMPFSAIYEILERRWPFTVDWCDVWHSFDVLFSTASILNLCVISIDRYWAIKDPFSYPARMTHKLAGILIAFTWLASSMISFPAIIWWRAVRKDFIPLGKCPFTVNLEYIIFSSTISFYLPLFVMTFTYYKIYREAIVQSESLRAGAKNILMASGEFELTLRMHRGGRFSTKKAIGSKKLFCKFPNLSDDKDGVSKCLPKGESLRFSTSKIDSTEQVFTSNKNFSLSRKFIKFSKEKRAAKTLGIVMGVFIICWLPFFVVNLWSGFCANCIWEEGIISAAVTWLGWINSGMNPVIYACWSRDFRRAFTRILCSCFSRKLRRKYQRAFRRRPYEIYQRIKHREKDSLIRLIERNPILHLQKKGQQTQNDFVFTLPQTSTHFSVVSMI